MGWASQYISKLIKGETISFRPRGQSMRGRIESGQLVTLIPIPDKTILMINDIVLCKVKGQQYLHLIKQIKYDKYLIGNNVGNLNGWINENFIYGKVIKIEN